MSVEGAWFDPWGVTRRILGEDCVESWPEERRIEFLLDSAARPISADESISPLAPSEDARGVEMRVFMTSTSSDNGGRLDGPNVPGWLTLGFDVCDESLLSGLMNCSYTPEERERLSPIWSKKLNGFHLFRTASDAEEFRRLTDARVPEHAPFFVVAICVRAGSQFSGATSVPSSPI